MTLVTNIQILMPKTFKVTMASHFLLRLDTRNYFLLSVLNALLNEGPYELLGDDEQD